MPGLQNGKIIWTRELKLTLHLLNERHPKDDKLRTLVFNKMFNDHLVACGMSDGAPSDRLYQQYYERNKPGPWRCHWFAICSMPTTRDGREEREKLIARIVAVEAAAKMTETSIKESTTLQGAASSATKKPFKSTRGDCRRVSISSEDGDVIRVASPEVTEMPVRSHQTRDAALRRPSERKIASTESHQTRDAAPRRPSKRKVASTESVPEAQPIKRMKVSAARPASKSTSTRRTVKTTCESQDRIMYDGRMHGGSIAMFANELATFKLPLALASETIMHPPLSPLLFRFWDSESQGKNNDPVHGFVSGKHSTSNAGPQPVKLKYSWVDLEQHIDRNKENKSPFISTSACLAWVVRQALIRSKKSSANCHVSVIDTSLLDPSKVFYAAPIITELKRKRKALTGGAWMYGGLHEFLVWQDIPVAAIVRTFTLNDITQLARRSPAIATSLRLDYLADPVWERVRVRMKAEKVDLTPKALKVMAQFIHLIGVTPFSPLPQIERAVSEIVQGWCLQPHPRSESQWYYEAASFAHLFCKSHYPGTRREEEIKVAFLFGVQLGIGHINTLHSLDRVRATRSKAKKFGLDAPAAIVLSQLHAAAASVAAYGTLQEERYLLAPPSPASEVEATPIKGPAKRQRPQQPTPATPSPSTASSRPQPQQATPSTRQETPTPAFRKHQAPGRARPEPIVLIHTPAPKSASTDRPRRNATKKPNYAETPIIISDDEDEESEDEESEDEEKEILKAPDTLATPTNLSDWEQITYSEDEDEDEEIGITEEAEDGDEIIVF